MHHWQDYGFTVGSILFIIALIPAVLKRQPPPLSTTLLTGGVLTAFAVIYVTLDFMFSAFTTAITAALWHTLTLQNVVRDL